jgi:lactoylglutathione lyase
MDLEESIEFYKNAFGFEIVTKKDFPKDKFTLVFLKGDKSEFEIELTYNYDREEPYEVGDGYSHIALTVKDIEASHKYHKELGYDVGDIKKISEEGSGLYFVSDPDGYDIEVIEE